MRIGRIELPPDAWEASVLPLNYIRREAHNTIVGVGAWEALVLLARPKLYAEEGLPVRSFSEGGLASPNLYRVLP